MTTRDGGTPDPGGAGGGPIGRVILAHGVFRLRRRRGPGAGGRAGRPGLKRVLAGAGLAFEKWQAAGNDFLLVWDAPVLPPPVVAHLCHRRLGVGADGAMWLRRRADALDVQFFNGDGGAAEFSGNGFRCAVASAWIRSRVAAAIRIESGRLMLEGRVDGPDALLTLDPAAFRPEVRPVLELVTSGAPPMVPAELDIEEAFHVKLGNPHLILLVGNAAGTRVPDVERALDHLRRPSATFPDGVNVSVAQVEEAGRYRLETWERGVGLTASCASAATALFHLLRQQGRARRELVVVSAGGTLTLGEAGRRIALRGPVRRVFTGTVDAAALEKL
jgi:diaminopimelate epimerase